MEIVDAPSPGARGSRATSRIGTPAEAIRLIDKGGVDAAVIHSPFICYDLGDALGLQNGQRWIDEASC